MVAEVKALACELPVKLGLPLSRFSRSELRRYVLAAGIVAEISGVTIWRWLHEDALRPWSRRSWIFPRDPEFATKAGRVLDLYHRRWKGRARTSSFYFKGKTLEMREIAERLRVTTLLEGSVRRAGNRVRITAQLIDVAKDEHLWSERYDREMEDIFAIQDEIARAIADRLKVSLEDGADTPLVKPHTENLEAYQLYLKGRSLLYKRGLAIPRGLECFKRALALDPDYALAHAGRADGNTMLGYYGFAPGKETMPQAKEAATKALELAPDLAEAHNSLCHRESSP